MKKTGIITHYYKSTNYGGNLQSYALTYFLNSNGYEAEQICYEYKNSKVESLFDKIKRKGIIKSFSDVKNRIKKIIFKNRINKIFLLKEKSFFEFNTNIPHSSAVYGNVDLHNLDIIYDCYIVGSDQVWNGYNDAYFLNFTTKKKVSYAASVSRNTISNSEIKMMRSAIEKFYAISVRENLGKKILESKLGINKSIDVCLDPCFLISPEHWESLCSFDGSKNKYMLCYFLGKYKKSRRLAKEYAAKKGLEIIYIPMTLNDCIKNNYPSVPTPNEFLGLIKNAEIVFTDSFHAVVFSSIFKKNFFVFRRDFDAGMASRIEDVCDLLNVKNNYINTKERETINYLLRFNKIAYKHNDKLEEAIKFSKKYLLENLGNDNE